MKLQEGRGAHGGAVGWGTAPKAGRSRVRFPMVSVKFFIFGDPVALALTRPLTEISTRNISWGVRAAGSWGWQPYHLHVPIVLKSESLNLLEPSGPVQACNGIGLPSQEGKGMVIFRNVGKYSSKDTGSNTRIFEYAVTPLWRCQIWRCTMMFKMKRSDCRSLRWKR
jgi:hypothetical protein